ncbi:FAD-dependent oxidoreductase [Halomarina litorea]|uniref:FAD-dependent oxidoreductase n=1 Tax=Halomarina litorea TaxID=2961595 RepID=UPI0020C59320|nr:FAD-dependent oxidoreductase [Halomarina sp. BCD28]
MEGIEVKPHNQQEAAESLPLISETARVTSVEPMDRRRHADVADAVATLLDAHDEDHLLESGEWGPDPIDWPQVEAALDPASGSTLERKVESLRDRDERPYPMLVDLRFETEGGFEFQPGQYVTVRYEDVSRPYSIASSPTAEDTALAIRHVPDGTLTPMLVDADPGHELEIRGPNGEFLLESPSSRDIVFLATGTGVAPFKSMIDYTFEEGRDVFEDEERDVWLFLGCAWEDDLPYREAFREYDAERENFHFVPTLSREEYLSKWDGETDYVQHTLMKYVDESELADDAPVELREFAAMDPVADRDRRLDPSTMEVYACGLSAMAYGLVDVAESIGVSGRHVHVEGYG